MAAGARHRANATYALSVTGVAGPEAAGDEAPAGTVYVGLADAVKTVSFHRHFLGDRQRIRAFTTQMALDCLRRRLLARP
jgi:PncC family amidohydrolase